MAAFGDNVAEVNITAKLFVNGVEVVTTGTPPPFAEGSPQHQSALTFVQDAHDYALDAANALKDWDVDTRTHSIVYNLIEAVGNLTAAVDTMLGVNRR